MSHQPQRPKPAHPPSPRTVITLCGHCRGVCGPFTDIRAAAAGRGRVYQLCACEHDSEINRPDLAPATPKFLCHTCTSTLLERASKWATAHCGPCARRVTELNTQAGAVVIPRGWHTIVNAASVRSAPLTQPTPGEVHHHLGRIRAGFDLLEHWRRRRIDDICARAGLPTDDDLTITTYTDAASTYSRAEAFSDLLAFIADHSLHDPTPPHRPRQ